jgi:hypothetical protein
MSASSDKKKKRVLALEARAKASSTGAVAKNRDVGREVDPSHAKTKRARKDPRDDAHLRASESAATTSKQDTASLLYAPFDGVTEVFPWLDGDRRSVQDVVQSLLMTNHRYSKQGASRSSSIVDKMKEKTLLLENPVGQKAKNGRLGAFVKCPGVRMASRKELDAMGCLNVGRMNLSYEDALVLHEKWKEYRDELLEVTTSKQDLMERVYSMEKHGAAVVCIYGGKRKDVRGIVVWDTESSFHVMEESGKVRVVPKRSVEVRMEVSQGRAAAFVPLP